MRAIKFPKAISLFNVLFLILFYTLCPAPYALRPMPSAYAAVPHLINYQGRLTDKQGKPLEGMHSITFRIYNKEGTPLWEETHLRVVIEKGIFSVMLGSVKNLDLAFDKEYSLQIMVNGEVMKDAQGNDKQPITASGYAITAERLVDEPLPTARGGTGATANANTANGVAILDASGYAPDNSVDTTALKTATGEVSATTATWNFLTLPGGEYGFYPQIKADGPGDGVLATIGGIAGQGAGPTNTSYATIITMFCPANAKAVYAKQRYVTSSGTDMWIFLLIDKTTKEIISTYSAPDHPAYGNGGDFDKMPHPFNNYDKSKHVIALLDKDTCFELKTESESAGKSILTLINEDYKLNLTKENKYQPLHSGKFLKEDKDGKQYQAKEMVNTIPNYIKVRGLVRLTNEEKENKRLISKNKNP